MKNHIFLDLKSAVRATLAWFAYFDRPLKKEEIQKYLFRHQITGELNLLSDPALIQENEYFTLAEDKQIIQKFQANKILREKYFKRAHLAARLLAHLPFVRLVTLINSLAMGDTEESSDIDLFIITAPKRLYLVRTLAIILLILIGLKKTRRKIQGKICLGFYLAEDNLDFAQKKMPCDEIYFSFWLATMAPLAGDFKVYEKFLTANKKLLQENLPNFIPAQIKLLQFFYWQKIGEYFLKGKFGDLTEKFLAKIHIKHTWKLPENHWSSSTTMADEKILKLHAVDRTKKYRLEWEKKINNF